MCIYAYMYVDNYIDKHIFINKEIYIILKYFYW